jgi:hypothetical protein
MLLRSFENNEKTGSVRGQLSGVSCGKAVTDNQQLTTDN